MEAKNVASAARQTPVLERNTILRRRAQWVVAAFVASAAAGAGLGAYIAVAAMLQDQVRFSPDVLCAAFEPHTERQAAGVAAPLSMRPQETKRVQTAHSFLVSNDGDQLWALLPDDFDPEEQAFTKLPGDDAGVVTLTKTVTAESVAHASIEVGDTLFLYNKDGEICQAEVSGFKALARHYSDEFGVDETELWDMSSRTLAAQLREVSGDCGGAAWASTEAQTAASLSLLASDSEFYARVTSEFRKLDAYRSVQKTYAQDGGQGDWTTPNVDGAEVLLRVYELPQTGLVIAFANSGGECGEPGGALLAVWQIEDNTALSLLATNQASVDSVSVAGNSWGQPQLLLELDFNHRVLVDAGNLNYEEEVLSEDVVPYFGCRC